MIEPWPLARTRISRRITFELGITVIETARVEPSKDLLGATAASRSAVMEVEVSAEPWIRMFLMA